MSKKNIPNDYIVIRVKIVHVKKNRFFGIKDKQINAITLVTDTQNKSFKAYKEIEKIIRKYGKVLWVG